MEHAKHIIRAVLLLVLIAVAFVLVRHFLYPDTFGQYGHFRFSSVAEYEAQPLRHGAPGACDGCHDEQAEVKAEGKHLEVSCEVCHGPLGSHVESDKKVAAMPVNQSYELCGWCHQRLVARRDDFPQVVLTDHVIEQGAEMSQAVCLECHDAHNPSE